MLLKRTATCGINFYSAGVVTPIVGLGPGVNENWEDHDCNFFPIICKH
jgi:hypothetical protein